MKLELGEDTLTVVFEGWERLLAMRRRLIIPRAKVVQAEWHGAPFEIHVNTCHDHRRMPVAGAPSAA
jgi:hypothetical protein